MAIFGANYFLGIEVDLRPLILTTLTIGFYNLLFLFVARNLRMAGRKGEWKVNVFTNAQISLDLVALTFLVHFSGGIENPRSGKGNDKRS